MRNNSNYNNMIMILYIIDIVDQRIMIEFCGKNKTREKGL